VQYRDNELQSLAIALNTLNETQEIAPYPVNQSTLTYAILRAFLDSKSKGAIRYMVAEVNGHFVIRRMTNNFDIESAYLEMDKGSPPSSIEDRKAKILRLCNKLITEGHAKHAATLGVDLAKKLEGTRFIPYTFLQKSTSSVGIFKNHPAGATAALKEALAMTEELLEVPHGSMSKYNTNCKVYVFK
jgi:hypothetical protein